MLQISGDFNLNVAAECRSSAARSAKRNAKLALVVEAGNKPSPKARKPWPAAMNPACQRRQTM
jgi:hypothetical protein